MGVAPHVSAPATAEDGYFGPRNNIEIWTQQVTHESLPWAAEEMEAATLVRSALIEVMGAYHQLQLRERATADLRQRMLNEELNHRVKNILSVVQSLVSQPLAPTPRPTSMWSACAGVSAPWRWRMIRPCGARAAACCTPCWMPNWRLPGALVRDLHRPADMADGPGAVGAGAGGA